MFDADAEASLAVQQFVLWLAGDAVSEHTKRQAVDISVVDIIMSS